jgi:hypothetical protein
LSTGAGGPLAAQYTVHDAGVRRQAFGRPYKYLGEECPVAARSIAWYKGRRELGSSRVPWEVCLAQRNALLLGDRTFRIGEAEKKDLRWEARQFRQ